jgi:hypothetical protein
MEFFLCFSIPTALIFTHRNRNQQSILTNETICLFFEIKTNALEFCSLFVPIFPTHPNRSSTAGSRRLRTLQDQLRPIHASARSFREESDTMGKIKVDDSVYWGAQTQRYRSLTLTPRDSKKLE